jgi:hypothetical protein
MVSAGTGSTRGVFPLEDPINGPIREILSWGLLQFRTIPLRMAAPVPHRRTLLPACRSSRTAEDEDTCEKQKAGQRPTLQGRRVCVEQAFSPALFGPKRSFGPAGRDALISATTY